MDARTAVKRIDHETGVIGKRRSLTVFAGGDGFKRGVFFESISVFFNFGEIGEIGERFDFDVDISKQFFIFFNFVQITGGGDDE